MTARTVSPSRLDYYADGVNGYDLGIIGAFQYAYGIAPLIVPGKVAGIIFRRRADEAGTYGGWRYECDPSHPARNASLPEMADLARRIAAVEASI